MNEYKYSDPSSKDSVINTYILKTPNKLQIGRNTVLNEHIQIFINPQMAKNISFFVFTLTIPSFMSTVNQRINSLVDACCYLLKTKEEPFLDKLGEYVK